MIPSVAILVADLVRKVAEAQIRDLGQVLTLVNQSVEGFSEGLAIAEREGRFGDAADLAAGIEEVYIAAAPSLPMAQRVILETIAQYWELKAMNARSRASAQAAALDVSSGSVPVEPAPARAALSSAGGGPAF